MRKNFTISLALAFTLVILLSCEAEQKECTLSDCEELCQELSIFPPAIELDLPDPKPTEHTDANRIEVFVTSDNHYLIEGDMVEIDELEKAIMSKVIQTGDSIIELNGDTKSYWDANVRVIDVAKSNQLKLVIKTKL